MERLLSTSDTDYGSNGRDFVFGLLASLLARLGISRTSYFWNPIHGTHYVLAFCAGNESVLRREAKTKIVMLH